MKYGNGPAAFIAGPHLLPLISWLKYLGIFLVPCCCSFVGIGLLDFPLIEQDTLT